MNRKYLFLHIQILLQKQRYDYYLFEMIVLPKTNIRYHVLLKVLFQTLSRNEVPDGTQTK